MKKFYKKHCVIYTQTQGGIINSKYFLKKALSTAYSPLQEVFDNKEKNIKQLPIKISTSATLKTGNNFWKNEI